MSNEKKEKRNWYKEATNLWGAVGLLWICQALTTIINDLGIEPILVCSAFSFSVVSIGIRFLKPRNKRSALLILLLPLLPLFTYLTATGAMHELGELIKRKTALTCASSALDGGYSIGATGCGMLKIGAYVQGSIKSITEAHNWQFSAQKGNWVWITVMSSDVCPQISVLDSGGSVLESFTDENESRFCLSGLTTTSYYGFNPPAHGTYIIHLIAPEKPGAYWLKID